jgi:hypothetical protein
MLDTTGIKRGTKIWFQYSDGTLFGVTYHSKSNLPGMVVIKWPAPPHVHGFSKVGAHLNHFPLECLHNSPPEGAKIIEYPALAWVGEQHRAR